MQKVFWSVFAISALASVFASLLFFRWPWSVNPKVAEEGSAIKWVLLHPDTFLLCCLILFLSICVIGLIGRLDNGLPERELKRYYLHHVILGTERLAVAGTPAGLIVQSVPLDEVFIPLDVRANRPLTDYPLTADQLGQLRSSLNHRTFSDDMQQVLIGAEEAWYHLKQNDRVSIAHLWQHLTRNTPAAVVQGYPGMGKSTLIARLALHMARRCLRLPDPLMGTSLTPPCVPLVVQLRDYAEECAKASGRSEDLSLLDYLMQKLGRLPTPALPLWIHHCLQAGRCVILLDGLDEVNDLVARRQVQEAIKMFVLEQRNTFHKEFNRFLITSRVAGYDQAAFPDYPHYTIAELTDRQIERFLASWYRANGEARQVATQFMAAIGKHRGLRELAENPLLLTLLAMLQRQHVTLPKQRVELYTAITRMFLEDRKTPNALPLLSEALTLERLGPIAFRMQERGTNFVRQREMMDSLRQTLSEEGVPIENLQEEAEYFLRCIRERGGIFIQRTGDFFGFFHRTFQEYFVARYLFAQIKQLPGQHITDIVTNVCRHDGLWREPFLLLVSYSGNEDQSIARELIGTLLRFAQQESEERSLQELQLAVECIIEAKPLALGHELERRIALELSQHYEEVQSQSKEICKQIEDIMVRWLLSASEETNHSGVLEVLRNRLIDTGQVIYQRATLHLLDKCTAPMSVDTKPISLIEESPAVTASAVRIQRESGILMRNECV